MGILKQTIHSILQDYQDNWVDALQPATFAINSTPSSVTGLSGYFLNHGRHPVLPKELPLYPAENAAEHHPREKLTLTPSQYYCALLRIS